MSNLKFQKKLASKVLGVGKDRVKIDSAMAEEFEEAITREDIRELVAAGAIEVAPKKGVSRHRARKRHAQKKKGRRRGHGKRKGRAGARAPKKRAWINKIRAIRRELKSLRGDAVLTDENYRMLYRKASGGFFRNRHHLLVYIQQHRLAKKSVKDRLEGKKKPKKTMRKKKGGKK